MGQFFIFLLLALSVLLSPSVWLLSRMQVRSSDAVSSAAEKVRALEAVDGVLFRLSQLQMSEGAERSRESVGSEDVSGAAGWEKGRKCYTRKTVCAEGQGGLKAAAAVAVNGALE